MNFKTSLRTALLLCLVAGSAPAATGPLPPSPEAWREVRTREASLERTRENLSRAFRHRFADVLEDVSFESVGLRVLTDGDEVRVHADRGTLRVAGADGGFADLSARIDLENLDVGFAGLSTGTLELRTPPRARVVLEGSRQRLLDFLVTNGFRQAQVSLDPDRDEVEFGGKLSFKVLFFRISPRLKARGRFAFHAGRYQFLLSHLEVDNVPGLVAAIIKKRLKKVCSRAFGLHHMVTKLESEGLEIETVRLEFRTDGELEFASESRRRQPAPVAE